MRIFRILVTILLVALLGTFLVFYVIPAFRGELHVQSDIIFGPVRIHLYGLVLAMAIILAWLLGTKLAPSFGLTSRQVDEALLWVVIGGFLGARAYFVIFFWDYFRENPQDILAIWKGGLAIYGAIIGGLVGSVWYTRKAGIASWKFLDLVALTLPLAQGIGRWGNFFNQEAFGYPTTLPWRMYVSPAFRPSEYLAAQFFHPTFLYESLWNVGVFLVLLFLLSEAKSRTGVLLGSYLILYSLGRFFIEGLRLDSFMAGGFRVDQITSLVMMIGGAIILWVISNHGKTR